MKWQIAYTHQANQDLQAIYEYIAFTLEAPAAAQDLYHEIIGTIRSLDTMPQRFPLYKHRKWHNQELRFAPVENYLVFYKTDTDTACAYIVRILYGGRDIERQLGNVELVKEMDEDV